MKKFFITFILSFLVIFSFYLFLNNNFKIKLEDFKKQNNLVNSLKISNDIGIISNYKILNKQFIIGKNNYFILRSFTQNNKEKYLIVEDKTYKTFVVDAEYIIEKQDYGDLFKKSGYKKNLDLVYNNRVIGIRKGGKYLQNAGLKSGKKPGNNIFLTADFCPSKKTGFEEKIFKKFIKAGNKNIAIAITSAWINGHQKDFEKLIKWNNSKKLNITWINHTKTHKYNFTSDFSTTFILTPGLILQDEILDVEKRLLEKAQIPSIFLRYPGLISNEKIFEKTIYKYGLIPIGSNTWLAKGEKIKSNSIILIHGNKNEPSGIKIFDKILDKKTKLYYNSINNSLTSS